MKRTDADTTITKNTHRMEIWNGPKIERKNVARVTWQAVFFPMAQQTCRRNCSEHMILITQMNVRKTVVVDGVRDFLSILKINETFGIRIKRKKSINWSKEKATVTDKTAAITLFSMPFANGAGCEM